jgi:antitoxin ParD1/3/4
MPSKHILSVSLTEQLSALIAAQVASGRFSSASEVVRAGLRLLERDLAGAAPTAADGSADATGNGGERHATAEGTA